MANLLSPSVNIRERSIPAPTTRDASTVLTVVGFTTKGPVNEPTLLTGGVTQFKEIFGNGIEEAPFASITVKRALNAGGRVLFYRIAAEDAEKSSLTIEQSDLITFNIESKQVGTGNTDISVALRKEEDELDETIIHNFFEVYYDDDLKETFEFSLDETSDDYLQTLVNRDVDNGGSRYVQFAETDGIVIAETNTDLDFEELEALSEESYLTGGSNGFVENGTEPDNDNLYIEALSVTNELANQDVYDYHLLTTPDSQEQSVQSAALSLAQQVDAFYLIDTPFGLTSDDVKAWHNGKGDFGRDGMLNDSFGGVYWSWQKDYSDVARGYIWCPPSVFIAAKLIELDDTFGPWYAPAGDLRGRIPSSDYEYSPSKLERDNIYGGLSAVNPIVYFPAKGILIYGQKTTLRESTNPLNRVNTRRMVLYIKKRIKTAMESILFEANNAETWRTATKRINAILEPIKQDNGLNDYKVIIDNRVNTAQDIQNSIMNGLITIVPEGTVEVIKLNLNVQAAGTTITEE